MKKLNKVMIGLFALSLTILSCKKSFIKANTDPLKLDSAPPEYLFTGATADFGDASRSQLMARYNFMVLMQYIVNDTADPSSIAASYDDPAAVATAAQNNVGVSYYNDYYGAGGSTGIGATLHRIEALIDAMPAAEKTTYSNLRAICVVLDTYYAWRVVDIYGAMPYAQAFQPQQFPLPAYDYDFTLYKTFDAQLKSAAAALKSPPAGQIALGAQDFYYAGDISNWLAFANTLRVKIAQRYYKQDPGNLTAVLADIQATDSTTPFSTKLISSNGQSFGMTHTLNYDTDTDDIDAILTSYNAGYAFVEFLKSTKDPRLSLLVRQNDFGNYSGLYQSLVANGDATAKAFIAQTAAMPDSGQYIGKHAFPESTDAAYGLTGGTRFKTFNVTGGTTQLDYLSFIQGRYFVRAGGFIGNIYQSQYAPYQHLNETFPTALTSIPMRTLWMTYGETCFMMAEIAANSQGSIMGESAATWYNSGVRASYQQYLSVGASVGVPTANVADSSSIESYLAKYPYNGLQSVCSQAWVHLMVQPEESYAMWKRTGYPAFVNYRAGQPTTTGNIGDGSGVAYMENLWTGSTNLVIPRRMPMTLGNGGISSGAPLNSANFNKAISTMQAKSSTYGSSALDTRGRIWWDNTKSN